MRYDKEIIDMENFYATATIEEAIAYFKAKAGTFIAQAKSACKKALRLIAGIIARFAKAQKPTNRVLRANITTELLQMNSIKETFEYSRESELFLLKIKDILREESKK